MGDGAKVERQGPGRGQGDRQPMIGPAGDAVELPACRIVRLGPGEADGDGVEREGEAVERHGQPLAAGFDIGLLQRPEPREQGGPFLIRNGVQLSDLGRREEGFGNGEVVAGARRILDVDADRAAARNAAAPRVWDRLNSSAGMA